MNIKDYKQRKYSWPKREAIHGKNILGLWNVNDGAKY